MSWRRCGSSAIVLCACIRIHHLTLALQQGSANMDWKRRRKNKEGLPPVQSLHDILAIALLGAAMHAGIINQAF